MKTTLLRLALCLFALSMFFGERAVGRIAYSPRPTPSGVSIDLLGSSWSNAIPFRFATLLASEGDTLCLRVGQYDAGYSFVPRSFMIDGGFLAVDDSDGHGTKKKFDTAHVYSRIVSNRNGRVLTLRNGNPSSPIMLELKGLSLEGGDATREAYRPGCGGGILVGAGVELTLSGGSAVVGNIAATGEALDAPMAYHGKGGGIYVEKNGRLIVKEGTHVSDNVAFISYASDTLTGMGGGIYSEGSVSLAAGSIFERNAATSGVSKGSYGGAIYNNGDLMLEGIENSQQQLASFVDNRATSFPGNTAPALGGAIYDDVTAGSRLYSNGVVMFTGNRLRPSVAADTGAVYPFHTVTFPESIPDLLEAMVERLSGDKKPVPVLPSSSYVVAQPGDAVHYSKESDTLIVQFYAKDRQRDDLEEGDYPGYALYANKDSLPLKYTGAWTAGKSRDYQVPISDKTRDVKLKFDDFKWKASIRIAKVLRDAGMKVSYEWNGRTYNPSVDVDSIWYTHGKNFKFIVSTESLGSAQDDVQAYVVVVNGRVLNRSTAPEARQIGPNTFEFTFAMTTFRDVVITNAIGSDVVDVKIYAPPTGTKIYLDDDASALDFQDETDATKTKTSITLSFFSGHTLNFRVWHDDALFFPPNVYQNGQILNRILWDVPEMRTFSTQLTVPHTELWIDQTQARSEFASLSIDQPTRTWLPKDNKMYLTYHVASPYAVATKWTSSDESIAKVTLETVGGNSLVCVTSFGKTGKVTITGEVEGQSSAKDQLTLEVREVQIIPVFLFKGATANLIPTQSIPGAKWRLANANDAGKYFTLDPDSGEIVGVSKGGPIAVYYVSNTVMNGVNVEYVWEKMDVTVYELSGGGTEEPDVLAEGETRTFRVADIATNIDPPVPADLIKTMQWALKTDDVSVAVTEKNGDDLILRALHYGKVEVTATADIGASKSELRVGTFYVARIELDTERHLSEIAIGASVGENTALNAKVYPEDLPNKSIEWSVSHATMADITGSSNTGAQVTLRQSGDVTVQAALKAAPSVKATCRLTTVGKVMVSDVPTAVNVGATFALTAKLEPWLPEKGILKWTSLKPEVAEVDGLGNVRALAPGVAKIQVYAEFDDALEKTVEIDVLKVSISAPTEAPRQMLGLNRQGAITVRVEGGGKKEWELELSSSRTDVMQVEATAMALSSGPVPGMAKVTVPVQALDKAGSVTLTAQIKGCPDTKVSIAMQAVELQLPVTRMTVDKGDSPFLLTPRVTPGNILRWRSTATHVATVLPNEGRVTPQGAGTAFIVAELFELITDTEPILSTSCEVIVIDAPLSLQNRYEIKLPAVVEAGKGYPLELEKDGVVDTRGDQQWTTQTPDILEVNSTLRWMKVLNPGLASLRVVADNGVIKTVTFEVGVMNAGIKLAQSELTLNEGDALSLAYTLLPTSFSNEKITWKSSSRAVSVDRFGYIKADAYGEAIVTATLYLSTSSVAVDSASCRVQVVSQAADFNLSPTSMTITEGNSFRLAVVTMPPNIDFGRAYIESDNPFVASVVPMTSAEDGTPQSYRVYIKGSSGGVATLSARIAGVPDIVKYCQVTVESQPTRIRLNYEDVTLAVGDTLSVEGWVFPHTAPQVYTLQSNHPEIAEVTGNTLRAVSEGTATVTAVTPNGRAATITVLVTAAAVNTDKLSLSATSLSLLRGQLYTLLAYVPDRGSVTWSIDAPAVALLDGGFLKAVAPGTATVTATDSKGNTASCVVTVNVFAERLIIYPYRPKILSVGDEFTVNVAFDPWDVPDREVTWIVDNVGVVDMERVNAQTCKISGIYPGMTLLSAYSADGKAVNHWLLTVIDPALDVEPEPEVLSPSASYFAGYLRLKHMAGYRATLTAVSGRHAGIFSVPSDEEEFSLSLPAGVYILTATRGDNRFVAKFVVR